MEEQKIYLPSFSLERYSKMRNNRYLYRKNVGCKTNEEEWFWEELSDLACKAEGLLHYDALVFWADKLYVATDYQSNWEKMKGENVVGEVYRQYIGEASHKHSTHVYSWMCVKSPGIAISEHGHDEPFSKYGKDYVRREKEIYAFCDTGKLEICGIGEKHYLYNPTEEPMFVVSCKVVPNMRIRKNNLRR